MSHVAFLWSYANMLETIDFPSAFVHGWRFIGATATPCHRLGPWFRIGRDVGTGVGPQFRTLMPSSAAVTWGMAVT